MTDIVEKHYSIDPGLGKKMDGCPYSIYEDGHDVKDYIIPPKGYVFEGFSFDPDSHNQIYDGKLTAEYTKLPFDERFRDNLWKFILAFVILAIVAVIAILAAGVFKKPSSNVRPPKAVKTAVQPNDTLTKQEKTASVEVTTTTDTSTNAQASNDKVAPVSEETANSVTKTQQLDTNDPTYQFKKEFWALIHQRSNMMDLYHELYTSNKGKVECQEFDYLRFTILKDYNSFKDWYYDLKKIPESQLQSIESIDVLINKMNE